MYFTTNIWFHECTYEEDFVIIIVLKIGTDRLVRLGTGHVCGPLFTENQGNCYVHPVLLLGHPANSEVMKMPFREIHFQKKLFPETFRKTIFLETFRKNLLPEEESVIPEVLRNPFRKNVIRNFSGRSFFWKISFYFQKKDLPKS